MLLRSALRFWQESRPARRQARIDMRTSRNLDLGLESLESRLLLAGDVAVNVSGDNITIIGDNEGNDIAVFAAGGEIVVAGFATSVEGQDVFGTGVAFDDLNNLTIILLGGNDGAAVRGLAASGNVLISTASGSDEVEVDNVFVGKSLTIMTASESDEVSVFEAVIERNLSIMTASHDDIVGIEQVRVDRNLWINTASGEDDVVVGVAGDELDDELFSVEVGKNLNVNTASQDDDVAIAGVEVDGQTKVNTASGDDEVLIEFIRADGNVKVLMGSGEDTLEAEQSIVLGGRMDIQMGSGDDVLISDSGEIDGPFSQIKLNGNSGTDTLITGLPDIDLLPDDIKVKNFEIFV